MESPNPSNEVKPEYNENTAILIKDLIVCVAKTESGTAIMTRFSHRQEAVNMMVNLNMEITKKILDYDKKNIIPAKGGILNFARKGRF